MLSSVVQEAPTGAGAILDIPLIRCAEESDVQRILEIYNHSVLNTAGTYAYDIQTIEAKQQWFKEKASDGFPVLVAERSGIVCGFASYGPFRSSAGYQYTVEDSVYVSVECRGQGVAKALLQALLLHARSRGCHTMVAVIDSANAASIALHAGCGFREAGRIREVGFKFGSWRDVAFFQLIFSAPEQQQQQEQEQPQEQQHTHIKVI